MRAPKQPETYLADDTIERENQRRPKEQEGLRRLSGMSVKGHDRKAPTESADIGLEQQMGSGLEEHPMLDKQQFDGIDSSVDPIPTNITDPKLLDEIREQQRELQLQKDIKLGLAKKRDTAPRPSGP